MEKNKIVELLIEKAKFNNDCITSEEISEYIDMNSPEFDEIEEILEDKGIVIDFDKTENEIVQTEEVKVDSYEELINEFRSSDSIRQYLYEIGNVPLLTKEEEAKYTKIAYDGKNAKKQLEKISNADPNTVAYDDYQKLLDEAFKYDIAREKLITANLRLVVSVAKRYATINSTMHLLDLIQEGNMGLMRAIDKFDYHKGFKFSTYATWWIRQSIVRAIGDQSRTIRIPIHVVETKNRYNRAKRQLIQDYGREPTYEELSEYLGLSVKKVQELENYGSDLVSLDGTINEEGDCTLEEMLPDKSVDSPEEYTLKKKLSEEINKCLSKLTPREETVLRMRFGLDDGSPKTLEEVGKVFDVTRERIRQIEAKALRKLKHSSRSGGMKNFLEFLK